MSAPLSNAPYLLADLPQNEGPQTYWARTQDEVRVRLAMWRLEKSARAKGSIFIFNGRSDYLESYQDVIQHFTQNGYACMSMDWRGQGLSDRLIENTQLGYVKHFSDYQKDIDALFDAAQALDMPKPYYLLAHSMGGCIALRRLLGKHPFEKVAFSAPMWGLEMPIFTRMFANFVCYTLGPTPLGKWLIPTGSLKPYVLAVPFDENTNTGNKQIYEKMIKQARENPELTIGSPAISWLYAALKETEALYHSPAPQIECLTLLGDKEQVVDSKRILERMQNWPVGHLQILKNCYHEPMFETPDVQKTFYKHVLAFFEKTV